MQIKDAEQMYRKNISKTAPLIDYIVLVCSLLLIKLPIAFGFKNSVDLRVLFLIPIIFVTAKNILIIFLRKEEIKVDKRLFLLYGLFIMIVLASFVRTFIYRTLPYSVLAANFFIWFLGTFFTLTLFLSASSERIKYQYRMALMWICLYYFGVNYLLYILGIGFTEFASETVMLRFFGINFTNRILFPTAEGVNFFGVTVGGAVVIFFVAFLYGRKFSLPKKIFIIFGILISIIIILFTDARGAFGVSIAVIFLAVILRNRNFRLLTFVPFISPFFPFLFLYISQNIPEQIVRLFSRSVSDFQTLNGRMVIWQKYIERIVGSAEAIFFGYGYRGQFASGISNELILVFGPVFGATAGAHNYILQWLLEIGIIGTLVFIILLTAIVYKLSVYSIKNRNDVSTVIMMFFLTYCIVIGTQDTVLTIDYEEIFMIFSVICASVITLPTTPKNKGRQSVEMQQSL